jgi:DNA-binding CsgD family transcriptional regulator
MTKTNREIRDLAIVLALANGKSVKEIAARLNVSYKGTQQYINRLRRKTETHTVAHLVAHYLRNNLIP